jgi:hypothetical protein
MPGAVSSRPSAEGTAVTEISGSTGPSLGTFEAGEGPVGMAFDGVNISVADSVKL